MRRASLIAVLALAVLPSISYAQHTGFTLFGTPSAEGKAEPAQNKFVAPVTGPYFHEDSFVTTDVRTWYVYQSFAQNIALSGGHANVYAAEVRVAITDELQLVANKDGYIDLDSGLIKESGYNDVAAGLKWNFLHDWKSNLHASVGVGYQFAVGDPGVLQNDQEARVWASINKGFGKLHLGATANYIKHTGNEDALGSSDRITLHGHADYFICDWFSPVAELNFYKSVNDGDNVPLNFSGADVANLGGGEDLLTGSLGFEIRPFEHFALRAAYETDLTTDAESIFGYRWTFSAMYSF